MTEKRARKLPPGIAQNSELTKFFNYLIDRINEIEDVTYIDGGDASSSGTYILELGTAST